MDHYNISMRIKKPESNLRLRKMDLVIAFDYALNSIIKLKMEGLAIISVDTLSSAKLNPVSINTQGTVQLVQPISLKPLANDAYKTDYDDKYFDQLEHTRMETFLENYLTERNETLHYDYKQYVTYGPADSNYIDVKMVFRIPQYQEVAYIPPVFQVLKLAWVQFFTLFLIFYILLYKMYLNFVVTGGVFDTIEKCELDISN